MNPTKTTLLLLSLLSGLLLCAAWPVHGFSPLLFIAFVPLLKVQELVQQYPQRFSKKFLFSCAYLAFFIWNIGTTWWIWNASAGGACMAILANALLMAIIFWLSHITIVRLQTRIITSWAVWIPCFVFSSFWLSFEYLHQHWDLTWPWLTIGNGFASTVSIIQWYEYTGTAGGSLWVLVVNALIAKGLSVQNTRKNWWMAAAVILVPVVISMGLGLMHKPENGKTINVVVVQPNVDPYHEKFTGDPREQLEQMLQQGEARVDETTDYLVFPETAISQTIWENDQEKSSELLLVKRIIQAHPRLKIVIGAVTAYQYQQGEAHTPTTRKFRGAEMYYEDFNTAFQVDSTFRVQKYHKSRFVPGVERMPFPGLLKPLEKLAIDMGGTTGSLCGQEERGLLYSSDSAVRVAPVICYESVFGEFVGDYVRKGANIIFIITNDGWWDDTPGYKQHLAYAKLRAIENRMYIARSANTGTSCFIDPTGAITQATNWWEPAVIKTSLTVNNEKTIYAKWGDYLSTIMLILSSGIILIALIIRKSKQY